MTGRLQKSFGEIPGLPFELKQHGTGDVERALSSDPASALRLDKAFARYPDGSWTVRPSAIQDRMALEYKR